MSREEKATRANPSGHFEAEPLSAICFANVCDFQMSPYESKLSTDSFENPQPLSNLFGQANKSAGWMPWH